MGPLGLQVIKSKYVYYNPTEAGTDVTADTVAIGGDWAGGAVWGQVAPISVSLSDQATINDGGTQVNLWQRNMFALRVEAEMGFRLTGSVNKFFKLSGAVTQ